MRTKPKVGDLVRLKESSYDDWPPQIARPPGHNASGIVVGHVGIRSRVVWTDGFKSVPENEVLEVINES